MEKMRLAVRLGPDKLSVCRAYRAKNAPIPTERMNEWNMIFWIPRANGDEFFQSGGAHFCSSLLPPVAM
jgi:hypothetical protein